MKKEALTLSFLPCESRFGASDLSSDKCSTCPTCAVTQVDHLSPQRQVGAAAQVGLPATLISMSVPSVPFRRAS